MADSRFWSSLAEEFAKLVPAGGLCLKWQLTTGHRSRIQFKLTSDINSYETFRLKYEQIARRAGAARDERGDQDSLEVWFHELRNNDKDPRNQGQYFGPEVLDNGTEVWHQLGRIPNVCEASARRCYELEMLEFEAERLAKRQGGLADRRQGEAAPKSEPTVAVSKFPGTLLSRRDSRVHDIVGPENFRTLGNAEIMKRSGLRKLLATEGLKPGADATKACLDRIRRAKCYPPSREIAGKGLSRK